MAKKKDKREQKQKGKREKKRSLRKVRGKKSVV